MNRRLAAILISDVVGYSRLIEADEPGTLAALKDRRKGIVEPLVREHRGRIVKFTGDGVLVEFQSAVGAVACALAIQKAMAEANTGRTVPILLRIGINLGEVVEDGADIFGDGVNVAARLEALAEAGGICVSAKVHDEAAGKLACVFTDMGVQTLKNITKAVRAYRVEDGVAPSARTRTGPQKPTVAVLPLDTIGGDPGQQSLTDGLTEDIITELSRFRNLDVLSRHAAHQLSKRPGGPLPAALAAGCTYVVEGSVRRAGGGHRLTVQLIETKGGAHVWADRFDVAADLSGADYDDLVATVASSLDSRINASILSAVRQKPESEWSAYDYFLRGRELCNYQNEPLSIPYFAKALQLEPNLAPGHAWMALAQALSFHFDANPQTLQSAARAGARALELDDADFFSHWANAMVCLWQRDYDRARTHFERSIQLNPSKRQVKADFANWYRFAGRNDEALAMIEAVLKRDQFPATWYSVVHGHILYDHRRYEEAIAALSLPGYRNFPSHLQAVAAHHRLGREDVARKLLAEVALLRPDMTLTDIAAVTPYRDAAMLAHLIDPLRDLGVPE
ncbi:MAG: adenylate/guanylate cyclase domain-containing protein [Hyphomicrobiales bacterium]